MRNAKMAALAMALALGGIAGAYAQTPGACRPGPEAKCAGANLEGRDLRGVNLRRADFNGAKLSGANLAGADLGNADFSGADLRFANLGGAALFGTKLVGANLTGAGLRFQDLKSDTDVSRALMPDGKMCAEGSVGDCKNPTTPPRR
ncbi:MAG: pentapeptide repeat-containing protein [Tagaea sp.]|nr:pentapeptide repeat-containing protein [Tagaea sp.]